MLYTYRASTSKGIYKKGILEAESLDVALSKLKERQLVIIDIKEIRDLAMPRFYFGRITLDQKMVLAKNLSTLIKSGVNLLEALDVLREQTTSRSLKKIIQGIRHHIESGKSLAQALSSYPKVFDSLFVSLIQIGEKSGNLESNLYYLSTELEKRIDFKKKIYSALMYPVIIVLLTIFLMITLIFFVLPRIIPLYKNLQLDLPDLTKAIIRFTEFLHDHTLSLVIGSVIFFILFKILTSLKILKPVWHLVLIYLPLTGKLYRSMGLSNFTRTFGLLIKSGIPVMEAAKITSESMQNYVYKISSEKIFQNLAQGKKLYEIMLQRRRKVFPPIVLSMVKVGEESGRLDEILLFINDYYEKEVNDYSKRLSSVLEPILLIIIGFLVAIVAASIILPIYKFTSSIRMK